MKCNAITVVILCAALSGCAEESDQQELTAPTEATAAATAFSTTSSSDEFRLWGATSGPDGQFENTGDSYTLHSYEWRYFGTDSVKIEYKETTQSFGAGDVYNGGWIETWIAANDTVQRLPNIEAELDQDHVIGLPEGGYADLIAHADEGKSCEFKFWRIDGIYSYATTIRKYSGDGAYDFAAYFQCGDDDGSGSGGDPCVDCL